MKEIPFSRKRKILSDSARSLLMRTLLVQNTLLHIEEHVSKAKFYFHNAITLNPSQKKGCSKPLPLAR